MKLQSIVGWLWRYPLLVILFLVTYVGGRLAVQGTLPDIEPESGPLPETLGMLVIAIRKDLLAQERVPVTGPTGRPE